MSYTNAQMRDGKSNDIVSGILKVPTKLSPIEEEEEGGDWKALLAIRSVLPEDGRDTRMVACVTASSSVHTDIVIRRRCTKDCIYERDKRVRCNSLIPVQHGEGVVHYVTYAIRDIQAAKDGSMPADNYVAATINALYLKNGGYSFIKLSMTDLQVDRMEQFCRSQLASKYSSRLCCCVNEMCCIICLTLCDCSPWGLSTEPLSKTGKIEGTRRWFCSEFTTAALIASGYLPPLTLSPSITTPGRIADYIVGDMKEPTIPRKSAVSKEVLDYESKLDLD